MATVKCFPGFLTQVTAAKTRRLAEVRCEVNFRVFAKLPGVRTCKSQGYFEMMSNLVDQRGPL